MLIFIVTRFEKIENNFVENRLIVIVLDKTLGYSLSLESARLDLGFDLIVGFSDSDSDEDNFFLFVGFSLDPVALAG